MLSSKVPVELKLGQASILVLTIGQSLTPTSEVVTDASCELVPGMLKVCESHDMPVVTV